MPVPVTWFARLPDIVAQIEATEQATFDRSWIEMFFDLRRTAAGKLLKGIPGAFQAGPMWMIHRRELLLWLYRFRSDGVWRPDAARRERVAKVIEEGRKTIAQTREIAEVSPKVLAFGIDELPGGVSLLRGELKVSFNGFQDLFTKLFTFAQILANDEVRLRSYLDS
jgi:hypothetical protein